MATPAIVESETTAVLAAMLTRVRAKNEELSLTSSDVGEYLSYTTFGSSAEYYVDWEDLNQANKLGREIERELLTDSRVLEVLRIVSRD